MTTCFCVFSWKHKITFLLSFFTILAISNYAVLYKIQVFKQYAPTGQVTTRGLSYQYFSELGENGASDSEIRNARPEVHQFSASGGYDVKAASSNEPIHVLLVTYMRGGSSFIGEMFNQNADVFYWFEPLAASFRKWLRNVDSRNWFLHDDLSLRRFSPKKKQTLFSVLSNIFSCRIQLLPDNVINDKFAISSFWNKSLSLNSYRDCLYRYCLSRVLCTKHGHSRSRSRVLELYRTCERQRLHLQMAPLSYNRSSLQAYSNGDLCMDLAKVQDKSHDLSPYVAYFNSTVSISDGSQYRRCSTNIIEVCKQRPIRAIKTVRMRMDLVLSYLTSFPNVKVVYVWRNPLGILYSRWSSSKDHRISNYTLDTDILCKQMRFDLAISDRLRARFPDAVTVVKYEDFVDDTLSSVSRLYADLGIGSAPDSLFSWIDENTRAETTSGPLSTRKNSTAVVRQWKTQLTRDVINYIKEKCKDVIKKMDYEDDLLL